MMIMQPFSILYYFSSKCPLRFNISFSAYPPPPPPPPSPPSNSYTLFLFVFLLSRLEPCCRIPGPLRSSLQVCDNFVLCYFNPPPPPPPFFFQKNKTKTKTKKKKKTHTHTLKKEERSYNVSHFLMKEMIINIATQLGFCCFR